MTPGGTTPEDLVPATSSAGVHERPGEHTAVPGASGTRSVDVGNMRYRGEVVVAESFEPEHGEPLPPNLDFRLVFFTLPRRIAREHLRDRRIAMAAPAGPPDERRQGLAAELAAIKETRARYTADPGSGTPGPTNRAEAPMAEREGQLRALIAKRDTAKYSGGRVYTRQDSPIDASAVFTDDDFDGWVRRLTAALLGQTGARPAFDGPRIPDIVTAKTLSSLLRELVNADSPPGGLLEGFGPALGIVDASGETGPAVNLVHAYVGSRGGRVPADDLIRTLGEEHRASADLAALYLLAFILSEKGEIQLGPDHGVMTRAGRALGSDRLSWDLVPEVEFSVGVGRYFTSVSATASCDGHSSRPYVRELPGPSTGESWDEVSIALAALGRRAELAAATTGRLATGLERPADAGITRATAGLRKLSAATDFSGLVTVAREQFGSPAALAAAIALVGGIETMSPLVEPIVVARRYLVGMAFGAENADLELERDAALARIDIGQLTMQPSLWSVVERTIVRLKDDFRVAYEAHHADYHRRAQDLGKMLQALGLQIAAIERLNRISELGEPVAPGLPGEFESAVAAVKTCPSPTPSDLSVAPVCARCALTLTDEMPDGETITRKADATMAEHGHRLGLAASGRVLRQDDKPSLALFLELVQAGDAAKIANVPDDEVVEFLRDFVRAKGE